LLVNEAHITSQTTKEHNKSIIIADEIISLFFYNCFFYIENQIKQPSFRYSQLLTIKVIIKVQICKFVCTRDEAKAKICIFICTPHLHILYLYACKCYYVIYATKFENDNHTKI
jgi:hypothetical protein